MWEEYKTPLFGFFCLLNKKRNHTHPLLLCDLEHMALSVPQFPQGEIKSLD